MPYFIAEIGSTWRQYDDMDKNLDLALRMIDKAKEAQANAVKFQMFTSRELYNVDKPVLDKFALPECWLPQLRHRAKENKLDFMCSAFSVDGFKLVEPYVDAHKCASPEASDKDIIDYLLTETNKEVFISDGGDKNLFTLFETEPRFFVLACISEYPAKFFHYLRKLRGKDKSLYNAYEGISDHTLGVEVGQLFRFLGSDFFEKHVKLITETDASTPDDCVSVNYDQFLNYVEMVKFPFEPLFPSRYARRKTEKGYYRPL